MDILSWILALTITSGQLIRIPLFSGGVIALDILVILLSITGLIRLKFRLQKPPFFKAFLLFIIIALISLLFTPLNLTLPEYMNAFFYTLRFSIYVLLSWIIYSGGFPKIELPRIFLFAGTAVAVLGLLQIIFLPDLRFLTSAGWDPHYFRSVSTFLDPNFTGAFLVLTLIMLVQNRVSKLSVFAFILVYIALLATFSRSSYLMFLISGLSLALLKKSLKYGAAVLILFTVLFFGFKIYSSMVAEPRNIERGKSASFRLSTWQQGLTIFLKNPFLGTGFNTYRYAVREYNLGDGQFLKSHGSSGNDASLLYVASTTGITGLFFYLYFLFSLTFGKGTNKQIILPAVAGLLIHSAFANSLFYPPVLAWLLLTSSAPKK